MKYLCSFLLKGLGSYEGMQYADFIKEAAKHKKHWSSYSPKELETRNEVSHRMTDFFKMLCVTVYDKYGKATHLPSSDLPQETTDLTTIMDDDVHETVLVVSHGLALDIFHGYIKNTLMCEFPSDSSTLTPNTAYSVFTVRYVYRLSVPSVFSVTRVQMFRSIIV